MEILPEDMGDRWHVAVVRQRALGPAVVWSKPVAPKLGRMGRVWTRGLNLPEDVAATTLPMSPNETQGYAVGLGLGLGWIPLAGIIAGIAGTHDPLSMLAAETVALSAAGSFFWLTGVYIPRRNLRKLHKTPVRTEEIDMLRTRGVPGLPEPIGQMASRFFRLWNRGVQESTEDILEQQFLALVRDVIRAESIPEASQEELRATLRAIGEAVASLPLPQELEEMGGSVEAADLRGDADLLLARAERESDPVVAASLRRQADALLERARAGNNAAVTARRTRVLREELYAQIGALRAALPTFSRAVPTTASAGGDVSAFARLAESVRGVATEAASVAAAQEELNAVSFAHRAASLDVNEEPARASSGYRDRTDVRAAEEPPQLRLHR